jgi:hypothetical protein
MQVQGSAVFLKGWEPFRVWNLVGWVGPEVLKLWTFFMFNIPANVHHCKTILLEDRGSLFLQCVEVHFL